MASERLIKRRIKSARNISQITRAMQMVAAAKMRKAQNLAISGRPYADKISEMVTKFVARIDPSLHDLLKLNTMGKNLIVILSTNKGLCGGLNNNLFRAMLKWFKPQDLLNSNFVSVGKKGENFAIRNNYKLLADFSQIGNFTQSVPSLTKFMIDGFIKSEFKEVYLVYNNFISTLKQEPVIKRLLPFMNLHVATKQSEKKEIESLEFLVEPAVETILDTLLVHYLENQVRDAVLQNEASEHSARMLAMKNATDNAGELIQILTLEYNQARQEKITYEIADIVTARLAVEN